MHFLKFRPWRPSRRGRTCIRGRRCVCPPGASAGCARSGRFCRISDTGAGPSRGCDCSGLKWKRWRVAVPGGSSGGTFSFGFWLLWGFFHVMLSRKKNRGRSWSLW